MRTLMALAFVIFPAIAWAQTAPDDSSNSSTNPPSFTSQPSPDMMSCEFGFC